MQRGTSFSHICKFQKCLPGWSKVVEGREGVPRVVSKQLVCRVAHGLCPCTHTRDTVTHPMHRKHGRCKHLFLLFLRCTWGTFKLLLMVEHCSCWYESVIAVHCDIFYQRLFRKENCHINLDSTLHCLSYEPQDWTLAVVRIVHLPNGRQCPGKGSPYNMCRELSQKWWKSWQNFFCNSW